VQGIHPAGVYIQKFRKIFILGLAHAPRQISPQNFVWISQTLLRYGDFWIFFSKWQPSAILDLLLACVVRTQGVFAGIYHCKMWLE